MNQLRNLHKLVTKIFKDKTGTGSEMFFLSWMFNQVCNDTKFKLWHIPTMREISPKHSKTCSTLDEFKNNNLDSRKRSL